MSRHVIRAVGFDKMQFGQGKSKVSEKNFEIAKEQIPKLNNDGDVLVEALWVSVDPYLMSTLPSMNNQPVVSGQIVKVIESKNKEYPIGTILLGHFGWYDYNIINKEQLKQSTVIPPKIIAKHKQDEKEEDVPDLSKVPLSHYVGAFGMPGRTAFYGLIDLGELKKGDKKQILVSGAAGAVGSIVGQIAKLYGPNCHVVGTAGSKEKIAWLKKKKIGFDEVLNYKDYKDVTSCQEALKKVLPNGIDIYFDNTGGIITDSVWDLVNNFAKVLICGQIAYYDAEHLPKIDPFFTQINL